MKRVVKRVLPPSVLRVGRRMRQERAWKRERRAGERYIARMLASREMLHRFQTGGDLPSGYGHAVNERCVEYLWALSQLPEGSGMVLDAGSTFNHRYVLDFPLLRSKTLHILTLAPEEHCYWQRGVSYLYADLRHAPLRNGLYDNILCVSVLEHIGCDNRNYTADLLYREHAPRDYIRAMAELHRMLKPGGSLLFTVPFGRYQNMGWQQQFDAPLLSSAIDAFGPAQSVDSRFYRYGSGGWHRALAEDCADATYGQGAVAATAVACVRLHKAEAAS